MTYNTNTPFHKFWKDLDAEAFIPLTLLITVILFVLYIYASNSLYYKSLGEYPITKFQIVEKNIPCPNGKGDRCTETHTQKYVILHYCSKPKQSTHIEAPLNADNIRFAGNMENPTNVKQCKVYNDYVDLLFGCHTSKCKDEPDFMYVLK